MQLAHGFKLVQEELTAVNFEKCSLVDLLFSHTSSEGRLMCESDVVPCYQGVGKPQSWHGSHLVPGDGGVRSRKEGEVVDFKGAT